MGEKYWFPIEGGDGNPGPTFREVYAGMAMQAILSTGQQANQRMAQAAVHAADVLMEELGVKK